MTGKGSEIGSEQQVNFLRQIEFFHDFDDHELRQLLAVTTWLKLPKNTQVIEEGACERVFYILVKGTVAVFKTNPETNERIALTTIPTGDCFGEMSLVGEIRRTAGVLTTTECFLLKVEPEIIKTSNVFLQLKFFQRFCEILVTRLVEANKRAMGHEPGPPPAAPTMAPRAPAPRPPVQVPPSPPPSAPLPTKTGASASGVKVSALPPMPVANGRLVAIRMQRRIEGVTSLPVNPEVAARIAPFLTGNDQNTRQFAELISMDPVLSFRVLQTANSPFFRRTTPVLTVPHAMIILGVDSLREVLQGAMAASDTIAAFGNFPRRLGMAFWKYSVVVGRIADLLKEVLRINVAPDVYLAGLLHRIGTLVLDQLQPAFYPQLLRPGNDFGRHLTDSEIEFVGAEHGQTGSWFGRQWGLPYPYQEVMGYYRIPQKARDHVLLVALVHLAAQFAASRGIRFGDVEESDQPVADSFAWQLVKEQHRAFQEANIPDFVAEFSGELTKAWKDIADGLE